MIELELIKNPKVAIIVARISSIMNALLSRLSSLRFEKSVAYYSWLAWLRGDLRQIARALLVTGKVVYLDAVLPGRIFTLLFPESFSYAELKILFGTAEHHRSLETYGRIYKYFKRTSRLYLQVIASDIAEGFGEMLRFPL